MEKFKNLKNVNNFAGIVFHFANVNYFVGNVFHFANVNYFVGNVLHFANVNNSQEKSKAPSSSQPPQSSARQTSQWVLTKEHQKKFSNHFFKAGNMEIISVFISKI